MEKEENLPKMDTKIAVKAAEAEAEPGRLRLDDFPQRHSQKTPFFKPRSPQRRTDTWLISLFVILHLIAFLATMFVNNCSTKSRGDCAVKALGRFSFQPLSENPFLGPSASTLDTMGALRKTLLAEHQHWRLLSCPWLHAGLLHFIVNIGGIFLIGIYLEQELGPVRVGVIYILSAYFGTLVAALFVRDSPVVGSSAAQFGLLGATASALLRNWKFYTYKFVSLSILFFVFACNFALGLLPYIANYANIGGLVSGLLLGLVLSFTPELRQEEQSNEPGMHDDTIKSFFRLKQKLDRPLLRSISLLLFTLLLVGFLLVVLLGVNISQYCEWCRYLDCIPSKSWSCNDMTTQCEMMESETGLTLTCLGNGNFRLLPYANISHSRSQDLCTMICS